MLLYDVARITSGYEISDSGEFAKRVMSLMTGDFNSSGDVRVINDNSHKDGDQVLDINKEAVNPEVLD